MSVQLVHMFKDKGKIKRTNGGIIEEANCISNGKDRIDLIFFDSKEDKLIVTNKREGVCTQRRR